MRPLASIRASLPPAARKHLSVAWSERRNAPVFSRPLGLGQQALRARGQLRMLFGREASDRMMLSLDSERSCSRQGSPCLSTADHFGEPGDDLGGAAGWSGAVRQLKQKPAPAF